MVFEDEGMSHNLSMLAGIYLAKFHKVILRLNTDGQP